MSEVCNTEDYLDYFLAIREIIEPDNSRRQDNGADDEWRNNDFKPKYNYLYFNEIMVKLDQLRIQKPNDYPRDFDKEHIIGILNDVFQLTAMDTANNIVHTPKGSLDINLNQNHNLDNSPNLIYFKIKFK